MAIAYSDIDTVPSTVECKRPLVSVNLDQIFNTKLMSMLV